MSTYRGNYNQLFKTVKEALTKADPIGLIAQGAPPDEYDNEVAKIIPCLQRYKTVEQLRTGIFRVFLESFGSQSVSCDAEFDALAQTLYKLLKQ